LLAILTLFINSSVSKEVECTFSDVNWFLLNQTLKTCDIGEQVIDDVGFTINSPHDTTVLAFNIGRNLQVEFLPDKLSEKFSSVIAIEVWNCSVKFVGRNNFVGLYDLAYLKLGHNKIERIEEGAFKDNSNLTFLSLEDNNLKYLGDGIFDSLINLKIFLLLRNQIRFIDPFAFNGLSSLEGMELGYNEIKFLDSRTFDSLESLETFSIGFNQLESLDADLFKNNKKLFHIVLFVNKLKSIDFKMFGNLPKLRIVDLRMNNCVDKRFFVSSVRILDMNEEIKEKCSVENVELSREKLKNVNLELKLEKLNVENLMKNITRIRKNLKELKEKCAGIE
jgi:hypothetical protein